MRMHRRPGFTLMEVIIVSGLMAFLAMLLASASAGIGRPAAELIRRSQSLQEMNMAVASLARDLGGGLANPAGRLGDKSLGQLSECLCLADAENPPNSILRLSFTNGTNPETVIQYYVQPDATTSAALGQGAYWLIREDPAANTTFTAARNINGFQVTRLPDGTIQISLSFLYRLHQPKGQAQYLTRTCSMIAKTP
jgi:prepilin-type N-terminal cleavage/methylation domain-containing protein